MPDVPNTTDRWFCLWRIYGLTGVLELGTCGGNPEFPEIWSACIPTCMDFNSWLHTRLRSMPECDKLHLLVQSAGPAGIAEPQLRSRVELPKKLVDELLQALVSSRLVTVVERGGERVYFAR